MKSDQLLSREEQIKKFPIGSTVYVFFNAKEFKSTEVPMFRAIITEHLTKEFPSGDLRIRVKPISEYRHTLLNNTGEFIDSYTIRFIQLVDNSYKII